MTRTVLRVLDSPEAIGEDLASGILDRAEGARVAGRRFLIGCPTGRTPRPIYAAMAKRVATTGQDMSHVVLVMMDEYLVPGVDGLTYAPPNAPWSCHHFARAVITGALNAGLKPAKQLRPDRVWFPDPRDPDAYEARIVDAGGIDYFLLASGASDGHVAFNPPGSPRDSRTRIIALSEETRRDNLTTFPEFGALDVVPRHGISVGIATIAASRAAAMVVFGEGKRLTLGRMRSVDHYDPAWPATVIHECAEREIVSDRAAATGA